MGLASRIARTGMRKGLLEGSQPWLVAGVLAGGVVLYRRVAHPAPEMLHRFVLEPGTAIVVRAGEPEGAGA